MQTKPDSGPIAIRPMDADATVQIAELEKRCFADPWSFASLLYELENPSAVYLSAVMEETVLGYVGMHHIVDEGHITNLAVDPAHRRRGIGALLLRALIAKAREREMTLLTLEVRASNRAAIALYGGFGFVPEGLRARYYRNPTEDAVIMTRRAPFFTG